MQSEIPVSKGLYTECGERSTDERSAGERSTGERSTGERSAVRGVQVRVR